MLYDRLINFGGMLKRAAAGNYGELLKNVAAQASKAGAKSAGEELSRTAGQGVPLSERLSAAGGAAARGAAGWAAKVLASGAIDAANMQYGNAINNQTEAPGDDEKFDAIASRVPIPIETDALSNQYLPYNNTIQMTAKLPGTLRHENGHRQVFDALGGVMGGRENAFLYTYLAPRVVHSVLNLVNNDPASKWATAVYSPVLAHEAAASALGSYDAYKNGGTAGDLLAPWQGVGTYALDQAKPMLSRYAAKQFDRIMPWSKKDTSVTPVDNAPKVDSSGN